MLLIKVNECTDCVSIPDLLTEIDCAILKHGKNQLIKNKFEINLHIPKDKVRKMIRYKSILKRRLFNPQYACETSLADIISRAKILIQ